MGAYLSSNAATVAPLPSPFPPGPSPPASPATKTHELPDNKVPKLLDATNAPSSSSPPAYAPPAAPLSAATEDQTQRDLVAGETSIADVWKSFRVEMQALDARLDAGLQAELEAVSARMKALEARWEAGLAEHERKRQADQAHFYKELDIVHRELLRGAEETGRLMSRLG